MMTGSWSGPLRGALLALGAVLNTVLWGIAVFALTLARLLVPVPRWQQLCAHALGRVAEGWTGGINALSARMPMAWDVRGDPGDLNPRHWYLVVCNHQSWLDVIVLLRLFNRRISFFKFFIKRQLLAIPIFGQALWALDMPAVRRYPREVVARKPHLAARDAETTRRACRALERQPVSVFAFLEGTRFTPAKHASQQSPYRNLLRPKAGGMGVVLGALGARLDSLLDVTLVYPHGPAHLWDAMCGRIPKVIAHVRQRVIPEELRGGDYLGDPVFREWVQDLAGQLWADKDDLIDSLMTEGTAREAAAPEPVAGTGGRG